VFRRILRYKRCLPLAIHLAPSSRFSRQPVHFPMFSHLHPFRWYLHLPLLLVSSPFPCQSQLMMAYRRRSNGQSALLSNHAAYTEISPRAEVLLRPRLSTSSLWSFPPAVLNLALKSLALAPKRCRSTGLLGSLGPHGRGFSQNTSTRALEMDLSRCMCLKMFIGIERRA